MARLAPAALRAAFQGLFRPGSEVLDEVSEGRQFDALYFSMLVFGCLIALLGLLLNSPAVIIGAMLISPLMGPILSCGLALTLADGNLAKKAGRNLGFSVVETIAIAALATWLSPLKDATPEILARTNPNLMDLLVAFFSGAAGTLALCSRRSGLTIVPGVAIATAVMPPLATVGYGISTGQWSVATGSFMLFFTNLASIIVSADIVFLLVGVRQERVTLGQEANWWVRHRMAVSWCILFALSVPLIKTLIRAADQRRVHNEIRSTLTQKLNHPGASRLDDVSVQLDQGSVSAEATVETAKLILPDEEKKLEENLSQRIGRKVVLRLDQIQLAQAPKAPVVPVVRHDYVAGGKIRPTTAETGLTIDEMLQRVKTSAHETLLPTLHAAGVQAFDISSVGEEGGGKLAIKLKGSYERQVPALVAWKVVCTSAAEKFNLPVRLTATMYLPSSEITWIRYRGQEVRPPSSELRHARRVLTAWKKQNLDYGFVVPGDRDAKLFAQRVEYLQSRLGEGLGVPGQVTNAGDIAQEAVGMVPIQLIDVSTTPSPVAAPLTK